MHAMTAMWSNVWENGVVESAVLLGNAVLLESVVLSGSAVLLGSVVLLEVVGARAVGDNRRWWGGYCSA